jgi:hypothetical protein
LPYPCKRCNSHTHISHLCNNGLVQNSEQQ